MYEIKTLNDEFICYCSGTHNIAYTHRNAKKTTTITIAKILESQYNILVDIFNYANEGVILTDLNTNKIFTDLFIDGEELRLNQNTLAEPENNEITYFTGDIVLMERG